MKSYLRVLFLTAGVSLLVLVNPAFAHTGHGTSDFASGWWHPILGLDHLLAMLAVGLLAVRIGGKALWNMPALFMGSMFIGGLAAIWGLSFPGVEYGITASVLVLGLLIAITKVVSLKVGGALVGIFALCHGHTHAVEMAGGSWSQYAAGFLLATALLHLGGVLGGLLLVRVGDSRSAPALRITGGVIAAMGIMLFLRLT